jgi:putative phosphotransacetylase
MKVKLGVSNRHVHIKEEHLNTLFGDKLTPIKNLVQPGEFASDLVVTIKTDKDEINNVRVLGPTRKYTQVEISMTDAYKLGLKPPVRDSGDLDLSSPITLVGPNGEVKLDTGCILSTRHIHITPNLVKEYGLEGISEVKVLIKGVKGGILHNVQLKVSENYALELHLDTDDANAFLLKTGDELEVIK